MGLERGLAGVSLAMQVSRDDRPTPSIQNGIPRGPMEQLLSRSTATGPWIPRHSKLWDIEAMELLLHSKPRQCIWLEMEGLPRCVRDAGASLSSKGSHYSS